MLYRSFSKLGWLGFGGPVATMAMMQDDCQKYGWMNRSDFDRTLALCKVLPGPTAFKLSVAIGIAQRGLLGGVVTGFLFTYPAVLLVFLGAVLAKNFSQEPWLQGAFWGMRPAVLAVILSSVYFLFQDRWKKTSTWAFLVAGIVVQTKWPAWEPLFILIFGFISLVAHKVRPVQLRVVDPTMMSFVGWTCLKAGALIFGSGLAIVPILEQEFVHKHHLLTHAEFMDGLSLGFVTPGPVVSSATYFGFLSAGWMGALIATTAIFAPSFIYTLIMIPLNKKLQNQSWMDPFLDGAIPFIIAAILVSTRTLARESITHSMGMTLFAVTLVVCLRKWIPVWAVLLISGVAGIVLKPLL